MKKKIIFAGLLIGVLSLNSCVKDNESDAVKEQRNAQTEKLKAEAAKSLAEAEFQKAQAEHELVTAAKEKALGEVEVKAKTISATIAELDLKVKQGANDLNIEAEKLKAQASVRSATAAFVKAKEEEELATSAYNASIEILKEAAIKDAELKAEGKLKDAVKSGLKSIVTDLGNKASLYTSTLAEIASITSEVDDMKLSISKYEAGFISFEKLYEDYIKGKKLEIVENKAKIEAYRAKVQSVDKLIEDKQIKDVEKLSLEREQYYLGKDVAALIFKSSDVINSFSESSSDLKFFEVLQDIGTVSSTVLTGKTSVEGVDVMEKIEVKIDSKNKEVYNSYPDIKAQKADELVDYFVDREGLSRQIKLDELSAASLKKAVADAKKAYGDYEKGDYKSKKEAFEKAKETDSDYVSKANDYKAAQENLNTLKGTINTAEKNYQNSIKLVDLRSELDKEAKVLEAKITEFLEKQNKVLASYKKYNEKAEEFKKVEAEVKAINDVLNSDNMPLTNKAVNEVIDNAQKKIAELEKEILDYKNDDTHKNSEQKLRQLKSDLAKKETKLANLKEMLRVYEEAYKAALEALKNYKG